ncbi:MAG: bifunctional helix-turn-helix transcriptional regulator/GNAT family N-acetyltransferase [Peptococcaceae bacterium]
MSTDTIEEKIEAVRHFNRFFTRQIGALREGLLHSPYSLTESRILFELAHRDNITAAQLGRELGLDPGYLSRTLTRFEQQELIEKVRAEHDGRQLLLHLTPKGQEVFSVLNRRSCDEIGELLNSLSEEERQRLLKAMCTIENILNKKSFTFSEPFVLRSHQPGDMGWITHRHGVLYAQEYGWDESFEALVAQIGSDFINNFKPGRERCWIAEINGEIVGSAFIVQAGETTAKLRLLLVEPKARGLGLGTRLVEECIRFAKRTGYRKMVLWTNSILLEARHIYQKLGFEMTEADTHHSFGHDLVGETWELNLKA